MTKPTFNIPTLDQMASNPSSMDDYDPNAMSVTQARQFIPQFLNPVAATEVISVIQSLGRVLAADIISPSNVPNHHNSAMDGFAFKYSDHLKTLKIIGTAFAGKAFEGIVKPGECVKIMTGAVVPTGADTVVMQERIAIKSDRITLLDTLKQGSNVRLAGEDLKLGQTVLAKGHVMKPADLGLIASLGIGEVQVFRQLKVAFFSTGDELVSVGNPLELGQIYDSNRYTLHGMLSRLSVQISDLGNVPDDPKLLEKTLLKAAENHDVVITSGGVSVGEADYMKALLAKHGQVLFWKINMKPGRPLAYGKIGSSHYFGLAWQPSFGDGDVLPICTTCAASHIWCCLQASTILQCCMHRKYKKTTGRTEFQRGILFEDMQDGFLELESKALTQSRFWCIKQYERSQLFYCVG